MKILTIAIYAVTLSVFYFYLKITNVNLNNFFSLEIIFFLTTTVFLSFTNYSPGEIVRAVKNSFNNGKETFVYEQSKLIISTIWKYLLGLTILFMFISFFYTLGTSDTSKVGPFIGVLVIAPLYALMMKFFIFMPLEVSLEKKIILSKKFHMHRS